MRSGSFSEHRPRLQVPLRLRAVFWISTFLLLQSQASWGLLLQSQASWGHPKTLEADASPLPCAACLSGRQADIRPFPPLDMRVWPAFNLLPRPAPSLALNTPLAIQAQPPPQQSTPPPQNKKGQNSHSANSGSPGHIFWIVPAFHVSYGNFHPLTPKEKFQEWWEGVYDPLGLGVTAIQAGTLEYSSSDGFCGYGTGFVEYMQCYGSMELDANDSSFFGDFVLAAWWHQDPRYFRLGKGGFAKRTLYAISRVFVTYNDSGKNVFYSSALAGTGLASVVSNLYYPKQDRGVGLTLSRVAIDLGDTALYNSSAEFWPDIQRWLHRRF